jgi:hypothetical protein
MGCGCTRFVRQILTSTAVLAGPADQSVPKRQQADPSCSWRVLRAQCCRVGCAAHLARKCAVAVQQHPHVPRAVCVLAVVLLGAHLRVSVNRV